MPIKEPDQRRLVGHETQAIDIPEKTDGSGIYGIDARVEGMVHGDRKLPPTRNGSKVVSVDDSAAKNVKGYLSHTVLDDPSDTVPGWVMVFADSVHAAIRAAEKVTVELEPRRHRQAFPRRTCSITGQADCRSGQRAPWCSTTTASTPLF